MDLINAMSEYIRQLDRDENISPAKFMAMQTAVYGCKVIVRRMYGLEPKKENAMVK